MYVMHIMNVLRTGMNMSLSRIHIWLWYSQKKSVNLNQQEETNALVRRKVLVTLNRKKWTRQPEEKSQLLSTRKKQHVSNKKSLSCNERKETKVSAKRKDLVVLNKKKRPRQPEEKSYL